MDIEVPFDRVEEWKHAVQSEISSKRASEVPTDILPLFQYRLDVEAKNQELNSIVIQAPMFNPQAIVENHYAEETQKNNALIASLREKEKSDLQTLQEEHEELNRSISEYNAHLSDDIAAQHAELLKYKKTLSNVFKHYHITAVSTTINPNLTEKQFRDMLHVSLVVCQKYYALQQKNFIYKYANKLKKSDGIFALWTLCLGVFIGYLTLPFLCIPQYFKAFRGADHITDDIEALKLARSLMGEVNYMRLIDKSKYKELEEAPDTEELHRQIQEKIDAIPDLNPMKEEDLEKAETALQEYNSLVDNVSTDLTSLVSDAVAYNQALLDECNTRIDSYMKEYQAFPNKYCTSVVMNHKWVFARKYDNIDVTVTVPLKNILFRYKNDEDRVRAVNRCKLYLSNIILSVQPRKLNVIISDPVHQGAEFAEFFIPEVKDYIEVVDTSFQDSISKMRKVTLENIKCLDTKSIDDFNAEAEKSGLVPIPYKLLIIASGIEHDDQGHTPSYDTNMQAYFQESVKQGVHIWILDTNKYSGMFEDTMTEEKLGAPMIEYSYSLGKQAVNTWANAIADFKSPYLEYRKTYLEPNVPPDRWWKYDTIHGVELHWGLQDGDPTKFVAQTLGDKNVHALMGGATGAGKSAAINQMLMTLITMYPPSELDIVLIDFKNVEAAKFTAAKREDGTYLTNEEMTELNQQNVFFRRFCKIPHISVISGTTDGGYAQTLFQSLYDEMSRRQAVITKFGFKDIENLRVKCLCDYNRSKGVDVPSNKEKYCKYTWNDMREDWEYYKPNILDKGLELPRRVVICDEFQVMFNDKLVPARTIDQITGLITLVVKLGRAMGCHLWFTSQSMKGTLSADTKGNFSLRAALRCDSATSTELLGNDASSKIKEKQGYMYTNDSTGEDPGANKYWRVPFADDDCINQLVSEVGNLAKTHTTEPSRIAEFFDDAQLMPEHLLDEWYEKYPDKFEGLTTFILGERAEYSENKSPVTCVLTNDSNENMFLSGFNREDLLNNTLTIIQNIKHKNGGTLILNVADKPACDILQPAQYVSDELKELSGTDIEDYGEFIDMISDLVEARLDAETYDEIIYVVLVYWENTGMLDFGRREDKVERMLKFGPTVGVHFFIASSSRQGLVSKVVKGCNHRLGAQNSKDAFFFIDTPMVEKFPTEKTKGNFAAYEFGTNVSKLKIYQHKFTGSLQSREVVI